MLFQFQQDILSKNNNGMRRYRSFGRSSSMSRRVSENIDTAGDILVIEDSLTQAENLRYMLEEHNYHVRVASNCREALAMMDKSKPEIIITDVLMPEMDGFTLCRKIKDEERFKDISVIIITLLADPQDVIKGLESGADYFVTKPYEEEYLLARIEHLKIDRHIPRCECTPQEIKIAIGGQVHTITSDPRQILNLLLSTYEAAFLKNQELIKLQDEQRKLNSKLEASNKELEDKNEDLKATNQELEAFGYTISHDLRQPLQIISSYSQAVVEIYGKQLDEQCKYYVEEITNRTFSMSELINALLNFSKLKHVEAKNENVDLSNMAKIIAGDFKMSEPNRKVIFEIEEGLTVKGDNKLLWLVIENLIGNAWKYSSKNEESFIEFGKTIIKGKPTFFVRDNGEGFAMLDSDKLFTPFQRLSKEHEGHGIGLATVHRIIKHHNGNIWAEGEPGKGATFYFTLWTASTFSES
jgi:two-component system sensor histidine kinase/response regulator